ncbi:hypothetical protein [Microseira sp. BLCC-F43]|jgi:hypothetical protein|uniref:hypothetical protein n=1 Tax=Microseira sp. BLCC-F43 TaxID=3153602 RepID=UPI0035BACFD2
MSLLREYIEKHPSQTKRLLGIDYDQLMGLITHAESAIEAGGSRPPKLGIAAQILFTLVYLHHLPTLDFQEIKLM